MLWITTILTAIIMTEAFGIIILGFAWEFMQMRREIHEEKSSGKSKETKRSKF